MGVLSRKTYPELKTKDIFEKEFIPLFIISKYLGLFSYTKDRKVSKVQPLLGLFFHLLHSVAVAWSLHNVANIMLRNNTSFVTVQIVTYSLSHGINVVLIVAHIIITFFKRQTFQEVIDSLLLIDTLWKKHSVFYSKKAMKVGMAFVILFYYILPIVLGVHDKFLALNITSLCFTEMCFFFIVMQFSSILDVIKEHLQELREGLNTDESHLINSIGRHQTLLRVCPIVNEAYSWQILIMCFKFFVFNLMVAYTIILESHNVLTNLIRCLVIIWEFGLVFPIARCCSEIEDEVHF